MVIPIFTTILCYIVSYSNLMSLCSLYCHEGLRSRSIQHAMTSDNSKQALARDNHKLSSVLCMIFLLFSPFLFLT